MKLLLNKQTEKIVIIETPILIHVPQIDNEKIMVNSFGPLFCIVFHQVVMIRPTGIWLFFVIIIADLDCMGNMFLTGYL